MIHFTSDMDSRLWGIDGMCQAQTIRIDDEVMLVWHSFPEGAIDSQIGVNELRSADSPELRSEVIYMPGIKSEHNYNVCFAKKLTERNYRALQSLHLVAEQFGGPFISLDNTSGVRIESDKFKITLYRRGRYVGFIWEEAYINNDLDWSGDKFVISSGRRTSLNGTSRIRINPFKSKLGYSWCPNVERAAEVWQYMRDDFLKMESEL